MLLVRSVREVDAGDIEPGIEQGLDRFARGRRRAESADDLRARVLVLGHGALGKR
jgi:hypothetical protein